MSDRVRVIRLVEYVGPREWVEKTVANSIHGTKVIRPTFNPDRIEDKDVRVESQITAITLGEFGESIADSIAPEMVLVDSGFVCQVCRRAHATRRVHVGYAGMNNEDKYVCDVDFRSLKDHVMPREGIHHKADDIISLRVTEYLDGRGAR